MSTAISEKPAQITLPDIPCLTVSAHVAHILTTEGELQTIPLDQARLLIHKKAAIVCHAPYTRSKLGLDEFYAFDVLELFAFVHPAKFSVPTPHGLCQTLGITPPDSHEDTPMALIEIATALLKDLQNDPHSAKAPPLEIAEAMGLRGKGWGWTEYIFSALSQTYDPDVLINARKSLNIWKNLPEWAEESPEPPPSHHGVTKEEAKERLQKLLRTGDKSEIRDQQINYTETLTHTFEPMQEDEQPHLVLAEAGTGTGKTLGYLAPSSIWAEKNKGAVWISTYTKNLQAQIDQELDRLYPDQLLKDTHVAVRKGRENYLCLLNFEDTANGAALSQHPNQAVAAGVMARWSAATKDGDLTGTDFPGWLTGILGYQFSTGLADRRGECIYSACDHYKRCFVERSVRKAKHARIVVANHALVMINAALSSPGEDMPSRYIFDEGHHLFDAADSAFAAHLSAEETKDFRQWILGAEGGTRSRARGLKKRAEDLCEGDQEAAQCLTDILMAASPLTARGWTHRFKGDKPKGETEEFLYLVYKQVYARSQNTNTPYSIETEVHPANEDLIYRARMLKNKLAALQKPMQKLATIFRKKLADDNGMMDSDMRKRLDTVASALERRAIMTLQAWSDMLDNLTKGETPPEFVDWMEVERIGGRARNVGFYRHHIDPMKPFATSMRPHVHGMAITSATLLDNADQDVQDWNAASTRTGSKYLNTNSTNILLPSPFNYAQQTRIFVANDVNKNDLGQVAGAYRALFQTSGGGGLGLFTAINRLKAVYKEIAPTLEKNGIPLYAQHIGDIDTGTLVDMFRDDTHACLLGTDAVRDGVDVPGESLRMIVFDR
ncbi:ATP-dependent DNA helicase, partial [Alphaproteobacteria bacterium]|nr:ATP-dependent DNA helicase [Alphaproteobacteria bacterium]